MVDSSASRQCRHVIPAHDDEVGEDDLQQGKGEDDEG